MANLGQMRRQTTAPSFPLTPGTPTKHGGKSTASLPAIAKHPGGDLKEKVKGPAVGATRTRTPTFSSLKSQDASFPGISGRCPIGRLGRCNSSPALSRAGIHKGKAAPTLELPENEASAGKVLIFDWDDTLLPTTFINNVIAASRPPGRQLSPVMEQSPFYTGLASVARSVRDLLLAASRYGRVGIVTLAQRPWVMSSAECFLPDLRIKELLKELKIPVFYASEHVCEQTLRRNSDDAYITAKRTAMERCVAQFCGEMENCKSAMSIGDSEFELYAIQDLVDELASQRRSPMSSPAAQKECQQGPFCKTVLLGQYSSLVPFQKQLKVLTDQLERLDAHQGNLDLELDESNTPDGWTF
eukprot:TRINITY_DN40899_c0_g1_i1.p1 TRINITY_DN40899_c0_g1~~TRINITY_DN40899_c0_g1_i1.p1  ORF type:complete len:357 (+),score=60.30 TRINITY_DN40899_c0_g1_i1:29-1099(+)